MGTSKEGFSSNQLRHSGYDLIFKVFWAIEHFAHLPFRQESFILTVCIWVSTPLQLILAASVGNKSVCVHPHLTRRLAGWDESEKTKEDKSSQWEPSLIHWGRQPKELQKLALNMIPQILPGKYSVLPPSSPKVPRTSLSISSTVSLGYKLPALNPTSEKGMISLEKEPHLMWYSTSHFHSLPSNLHWLSRCKHVCRPAWGWTMQMFTQAN